MTMTTTPFYAASVRTVQTQLTQNMPGASVFKAGSNGSRIHLISAAQNDTSTGNLILYRGYALRTNSGSTLALTNTTNSTITDSGNALISSGFRINGRIFVSYFDGPNFSVSYNMNNQVAAAPTNVAAGTLTFSGTIFNAADPTPPTSLALIQANLMFTVGLTSQAGFASANNGLSLLDTIRYPGLFMPPDSALVLGPDEYLVAVLGTAPSAGKSVDISVSAEDY
ncbi:MAG: hypothetical protein ACYCW6_30835 [Candidatus Xenobia bacterium]